MNPRLKYQLYNIGFKGSMDELQAAAFLDEVNKAYDKADRDRIECEKMLALSAKGSKRLYQSFLNRSKKKLNTTEEKYKKLLLNLQPYYFFYTKGSDGQFVSVSESVEDMLGFSQEAFITKYRDFFMYGLRCDLESRLLTTEYGYNIPYEITLKDKKGVERHLEITEFPVFDEFGNLMEIEGIVRDVTEYYKTKHKISNMLYYDALTGISNRLHLEVQMERLLLENYRKGERFAVVFIDLDYFKHINDTLGHDVGDELLQKVANGIQEILNPYDIFARIGGDEFVIIHKHIDDEDITMKIHDVMEVICTPWRIKGYELKISASIGVALYPEDGKSMVDLMKNADIAMYKSKSSGRNNFTFFQKDFNRYVHTEMNLIQDMSDGIEKGEFLFHYQPKVLLSNDEVIAAEALIRWQHPKMGLIYPNKFIDLAENTGLILKLGRWVIEEACRSIAWFNCLNIEKRLKLSINISIRQFQHEDMYGVIKEALQKYGVDGSQLSIEITESIMMENKNEMAKKLNDIKSLNVGISLDDFGTGYSTLSYLDKLSIDELKIDKAFVDAIPKNGDRNILLDTIIAMGKTLNMKVVAEGVEHEYQRKYLADKLCDIYQGYLFSKPVSRDDYAAYVEQEEQEKSS